MAAPLTALGPAVGSSIETTPWRRGRRLADEHGKPLTVDDVALGSFVTAFPEGARRLRAAAGRVRIDAEKCQELRDRVLRATPPG